MHEPNAKRVEFVKSVLKDLIKATDSGLITWWVHEESLSDGDFRVVLCGWWKTRLISFSIKGGLIYFSDLREQGEYTYCLDVISLFTPKARNAEPIPDSVEVVFNELVSVGFAKQAEKISELVGVDFPQGLDLTFL